MKTRSIIITGSFLITLSVLLTSFITKAKPNPTRTEEYAMMDVRHSGRAKIIHVSKSGQPTTETEWNKGESGDNYNPMVASLDKLNEEGFELVSVSSGYHPGSAELSQTFMLVKKIK